MAKHHMRWLGVVGMVLALLVTAVPATAQGGFDEYGYNMRALIFSGPADGYDRNLDGMVWGDPTYANDHLVMKWNAEWERGKQEGWSDPNGYAGAWLNNQWNGNVPGGSGESWHYKFVWVGDCTDGEWFEDGGYCIWGQFEVISSHGSIDGEHFVEAAAARPGYGVYGQ